MQETSRATKARLDADIEGGSTDYQRYLKTTELFACQKTSEELCNRDELAFQIVHQVEELWMKLLGHTLIDIEMALIDAATTQALVYFQRAHQLQRLMVEQFALLQTLSPGAYQEIRLGLGQGSGQESPTYRALKTRSKSMWSAYSHAYLVAPKRTLLQVYLSPDEFPEVYAIAESLVDFDVGFSRFRHAHWQLVQRVLGIDTVSLKSSPVKYLARTVEQRLFPPLWSVRDELMKRNSIAHQQNDQTG